MQVVEKFEVGKTYNDYGNKFTVVKRTPKMLVLDCKYKDGTSETKRFKIHYCITDNYQEYVEALHFYGVGSYMFPSDK